MILSGLLMYGASQRKRIIGFGLLTVLAIYLFATSLSLEFFAINMIVIFILTTLLKKLNCHAISGAAVLFYSVIIDIVCFYFMPLFPINVSLATYIMAGLAFNLRSAIPAIALGGMVQVFMVARFFITRRQNTAPKKVLQLKAFAALA